MVGLKEDVSGYYPPRARWYTRLFFDSLRPVRRRFQIEGLHLPAGLPPLQFLASLVVPGFAFVALGRQMLGWALLGIYGCAAIVCVIWLGHRLGEIGFGVMVSIHATSICFLQARWLIESSFRTRLLIALGTLVVVWVLFYGSLLRFVEHHFFVPLARDGQVLIVQRGVNAGRLKRGDFVAFELAQDRYGGHHGNVVELNSGMFIDRVLGLPGDHITFSNHVVFVNEQALPAAANMPAAGGFEVPEKTWFIWPSVAVHRQGAAVFDIAGMLKEASMVTENQMIGRPFKSWCGRRQLP